MLECVAGSGKEVEISKLMPLEEVVPELVLVLAPLLTKPREAELPDRERAPANTRHHQQGCTRTTDIVETSKKELFTELYVGFIIRSFDVTNSSSTSRTCELVRLHLTALTNQHVLMCNNTFEHAVLKDVLVQITGASSTRSRILHARA